MLKGHHIYTVDIIEILDVNIIQKRWRIQPRYNYAMRNYWLNTSLMLNFEVSRIVLYFMCICYSRGGQPDTGGLHL